MYGKIFLFLEKMPRLTKDQRVWVCLEFTRDNATEVKRRWPNHYLGIQPPSDMTIKATYNKLVRGGTCLNVKKSRAVRRRTARTQHSINLVRQSL